MFTDSNTVAKFSVVSKSNGTNRPSVTVNSVKMSGSGDEFSQNDSWETSEDESSESESGKRLRSQTPRKNSVTPRSTISPRNKCWGLDLSSAFDESFGIVNDDSQNSRLMDILLQPFFQIDIPLKFHFKISSKKDTMNITCMDTYLAGRSITMNREIVFGARENNFIINPNFIIQNCYKSPRLNYENIKNGQSKRNQKHIRDEMQDYLTRSSAIFNSGSKSQLFNVPHILIPCANFRFRITKPSDDVHYCCLVYRHYQASTGKVSYYSFNISNSRPVEMKTGTGYVNPKVYGLVLPGNGHGGSNSKLTNMQSLQAVMNLSRSSQDELPTNENFMNYKSVKVCYEDEPVDKFHHSQSIEKLQDCLQNNLIWTNSTDNPSKKRQPKSHCFQKFLLNRFDHLVHFLFRNRNNDLPSILDNLDDNQLNLGCTQDETFEWVDKFQLGVEVSRNGTDVSYATELSSLKQHLLNCEKVIIDDASSMDNQNPNVVLPNSQSPIPPSQSNVSTDNPRTPNRNKFKLNRLRRRKTDPVHHLRTSQNLINQLQTSNDKRSDSSNQSNSISSDKQSDSSVSGIPTPPILSVSGTVSDSNNPTYHQRQRKRRLRNFSNDIDECESSVKIQAIEIETENVVMNDTIPESPTESMSTESMSTESVGDEDMAELMEYVGHEQLGKCDSSEIMSEFLKYLGDEQLDNNDKSMVDLSKNVPMESSTTEHSPMNISLVSNSRNIFFEKDSSNKQQSPVSIELDSSMSISLTSDTVTVSSKMDSAGQHSTAPRSSVSDSQNLSSVMELIDQQSTSSLSSDQYLEEFSSSIDQQLPRSDSYFGQNQESQIMKIDNRLSIMQTKLNEVSRHTVIFDTDVCSQFKKLFHQQQSDRMNTSTRFAEVTSQFAEVTSQFEEVAKDVVNTSTRLEEIFTSDLKQIRQQNADMEKMIGEHACQIQNQESKNLQLNEQLIVLQGHAESLLREQVCDKSNIQQVEVQVKNLIQRQHILDAELKSTTQNSARGILKLKLTSSNQNQETDKSLVELEKKMQSTQNELVKTKELLESVIKCQINERQEFELTFIKMGAQIAELQKSKLK